MPQKINGSAFALARIVSNENHMLRRGMKIFCAIVCAAGFAMAEEGIYELNGQKAESLDASRKPKALVANQKQARSDFQRDKSVIKQDSFFVSVKDSVRWLEVEKNKDYTICIEDPNEGIWKSKSFSFQKETGNCIRLNSGNYVKSGEIRYATKMGNVYAFNILVEMKYIDLRKGKHFLGYTNLNEFKRKKEVIYGDFEAELNNRIYLDGTRIEKMTVALAVDRYMVTECEFVQMLWDSIPNHAIPETYGGRKNFWNVQNFWISKKKSFVKNGFCAANDSAAIQIPPYWAMAYANTRSLRDGFTPVYSFQKSEDGWDHWNKNGGFEIEFPEFRTRDPIYVHVAVNDSADGYRLPYYDEWMALARGGTANVEYLWGNESDSLRASQYAWFGVQEPDDPYVKFKEKKDATSETWLKYSCGRWQQKSRPVGKLKPNAFGLYDMAGLVCENVMLPGKSLFKEEIFSCKGGFLADSLGALNLGSHCDTPRAGSCLRFQGLRLVRQIR